MEGATSHPDEIRDMPIAPECPRGMVLELGGFQEHPQFRSSFSIADMEPAGMFMDAYGMYVKCKYI